MDDFIRADFHLHTKYSEEPPFMKVFSNRPLYGPETLIKTARDRGLNAIAITEHDNMHGANIAERYVKKNKIDDIVVIKGEEVTSSEGHILGLGIEEVVPQGLSAKETIDRIRSQGGKVIIPHPFNWYGTGMKLFDLKGVDGVETFNPVGIIKRGNEKSSIARKFLGIGSIGSTDSHSLHTLGKVFTRIKADATVDSILKNLKSVHTHSFSDVGLVSWSYQLLQYLGLSFLAPFNRPRIPEA